MLALPLGLALSAPFGCKPDICQDPNLTVEQRCKDCKPRDDQLLARLNPTELPYPVRKAVEQCADRIHDNDPRGFVTKQALRECTSNAPGIDNDTKVALAEIINRSNLMEQVDLENYHGLCLSNATGTGPLIIQPAAPVMPPPGHEAAMPAPAMAPPPAVAPPPPAMAPPPPAPAMAPPPPVTQPVPASRPAMPPTAPSRPVTQPQPAPASRPASPPTARPAMPPVTPSRPAPPPASSLPPPPPPPPPVVDPLL